MKTLFDFFQALACLGIAIWGMSALPPEVQARDRTQVYNFRGYNPCPATGATGGPCHGYEVDHLVPLCAGGPDLPINMQWLSVADHRAKTKIDLKHCAALRRESSK